MLARADRLVGQRARRSACGAGRSTPSPIAGCACTVDRLGLAPDFTVLDQADSADLMDLVRGDLQLGRGQRERRFPRKDTLAAIYSRMVNAGTALSTCSKPRYPWCVDDADGDAPTVRRVHRAASAPRTCSTTTICCCSGGRWPRRPVGQHAARQVEHVLVDEYQDTNPLQAHILRALRRDKRNLMVVGDDAQAIYASAPPACATSWIFRRSSPARGESRWSRTTAPRGPSWTSRTR